MKRAAIIFLISFIVFGCSAEKDIMSVAPVSKKLKESPFNVWYPQDWKFKTAFDKLSSGLQKRSYVLYHPRNKNCRITIEVIEPSPSKGGSPIQKSRIIAEKIRSLQRIFKKDGYGQFTMNTQIGFYLGNNNTTRLKVAGINAGIKREVVLYATKKGSQMCMVSYQWHNNWSSEAKKHIIESVNSFHF